jgi:hypothetical protein
VSYVASHLVLGEQTTCVHFIEYEQEKMIYEAKKQESELYLARFYIMCLRRFISEFAI